MKTQAVEYPRPQCLETIKIGATVYVIENHEDYTNPANPLPLKNFLASRTAAETTAAAERILESQFIFQKQTELAAEFTAYKTGK